MGLGISLPYDHLCDSAVTLPARLLERAFGCAARTLELLKNHGVGAVELRHFPETTWPESIVAACTRIWQAGLTASLHPQLPRLSRTKRLGSVFPWLEDVLSRKPASQAEILLILHAYASPVLRSAELGRRTEAAFARLADMAEEQGLPVRFALELNRAKEQADPSTSYGAVTEMCQRIGRSRVGICWDWGHGQANIEKGLMEPDPPGEFLSRVIHAHVHDLGPEGATHWPLGSGRVPLRDCASALQRAGYRGVYCLELSPEKFYRAVKLENVVLENLRLLAETVGCAAS